MEIPGLLVKLLGADQVSPPSNEALKNIVVAGLSSIPGDEQIVAAVAPERRVLRGYSRLLREIQVDPLAAFEPCIVDFRLPLYPCEGDLRFAARDRDLRPVLEGVHSSLGFEMFR